MFPAPRVEKSSNWRDELDGRNSRSYEETSLLPGFPPPNQTFYQTKLSTIPSKLSINLERGTFFCLFNMNSESIFETGVR